MVAQPPNLSAIRDLAAAYFPHDRNIDVQRMTAGDSTFVYRIMRGKECFYLRLLPEIGASFAPEVHAHAVLRACGVTIPEVIGYEHRHAVIGLSVMLTTEIAGEPLSRTVDEGARTVILFEAGRDLAKMNGIPVAGFGWILRDTPVATALAAELPTNRVFLLGELEADLALLAGRGLTGDECAMIERATERFAALIDTPQGWLAHGDLDPTHIYGRGGRYTGIIDFGEIRGAARTYDLGHFALRAWEADRQSDLDALLVGYTAISPLPPDAERRIALDALLIWVRAAARGLRKRDGVMLAPEASRGVRRVLARLRYSGDNDRPCW